VSRLNAFKMGNHSLYSEDRANSGE
jgi:hypothetical protein